MRLLFDFSGWLEHKQRGIGRYLTSLVSSLLSTERLGPIEVDIILPDGSDSDVAELKEKLKGANVFNGLSISHSKFYDFFIVGDFFSKHSWLSLKNLKNCKRIVGIVYDLIPLIYAKNYLNHNIKQDLKYAISLELLFFADHLFAISKSTKDDLCKLLEIPGDKITVLTSGFSSDFFVSDQEIVSFNDRKPSVFMISGNDRRKNYENAIKGFLEVKKQKLVPSDTKFFIACKNSEEFNRNVENITKTYSEFSDSVKVLGYIDDEELREYLKTSRITIFPSKYEGLGLPILESFASGTPCISSNLSSCNELNSEEFMFDPYSVEDIAKKISYVYTSNCNWENCLRSGRRIIKKYNWGKGAVEFVEQLNSLKGKTTRSFSYLSLFGCFPPMKSGIANVNSELLNNSDKVHAFLDPKDFFAYRFFLNNNKKDRFFSSDLYDFFKFLFRYKAEIFVLGNSHHNLSTLNLAIKNHGDNAWLYLHEAQQRCLLSPFCKMMNTSVESLYSRFYKSASKKTVYGLLPLIRLTGIKRLIVNNENCKKLVEEEISSESGVRIIKAFHPIISYPTIIPPKIVRCGEVLIGSFGAPSKVKGTDIIIEAVRLIRETNLPVKLLIAGYGVEQFIRDLDLELKEWIIAVDSPSDMDLLRLEKAVDISIQLRLRPHGESSGVISQLIGLGKTVITTEGFVEEDLKPLVDEVCSDITPVKLAEILIGKLSQQNFGTSVEELRKKILSEKSYKSLGEFLNSKLCGLSQNS